MRKPAFIIFLIMISAGTGLQAQFAAGVNGGLTNMGFSGDPPKGIGFFAPQRGYSAGFQFEYRFNDAVSISLNPGYTKLRSKYSILNDSATKVIDSTYFSSRNFSVPLHIRVWSRNGRFYVLAGIEMSYTFDFTGRVLISPVQQSDTQYQVAELLFYAHFGAGFIIPLGKPYLSVEYRYSQGLNDLTAPIVNQGTWLPRTKLVNNHLLVGFHYPIGKSNPYLLKKHR